MYRFPRELTDTAAAKHCFGGELRTSKMGFMHRKLIDSVGKIAAKEGKPAPGPRPYNISKLAATINGSDHREAGK